jgi:hypothetical protein
MWRAAVLLLALPAWSQTVVLYSRADAQQAHRAHALASAYGPAVIDRALPPGVAWRPTIAKAICGASLVLVVWSERAAASSEVRREIDTAMICRVPVVPVLLDSTPLPGLLGDVNAVDWRATN